MENLKKSRKLKKLTQSELASQVGVCRATIIQLEHGTCSPTPKISKRLSNILDVPIVTLYGIDILKYKPTSKNEVDEIIETLKKYKGTLK